MLQRSAWGGGIGLVCLLVSGCAPSTVVSRVQDQRDIDISGYWNDTDSRLVTEELTHDAIERPWLAAYEQRLRRPPVVIFAGIENRTAEHITQQSFLNSIQRELLNSGRVTFVVDAQEREKLRSERASQTGNATVGTASPVGQEVGADLLMSGDISYIEDAARRTELRVYQVDMRLIDLRDNRIVWAGQKIIRKVIGRARVRP